MATEDYRPNASLFMMHGADCFKEPEHGHKYRVSYQIPLLFWVSLEPSPSFTIRYETCTWQVNFDNTNKLCVRRLQYVTGPPRIDTLIGDDPGTVPSDPRGAPESTCIQPVFHRTLALAGPNSTWTTVKEAVEFAGKHWARAIECLNLAIDRYRQAFPPDLLHHAPPSYSFRDCGMMGCVVDCSCPTRDAGAWRRFFSGAVVSINAYAHDPPFQAADFPDALTRIDADNTQGDIALALLSEGFAALYGGDTRSAVVKSQSALEVACSEVLERVMAASLASIISDPGARQKFVTDYLSRQRGEDLLSAVPEAFLNRSLRTESKELWVRVKDSVDLRNEVVHEGRVPTTDEATKACDAFKDALTWLYEAASVSHETFKSRTGSHDLSVSFMGWTLDLRRQRQL